MKKFIAILSVALIAVLCIAGVSAAEDSIVWDFTDPAAAAQWKPSNTTNVETTADGIVVSGEGDDINLTYTADREIMLENYKFVVIEYFGASVGGTLQFYHWTEGCTGNPRFEASTQAGPKGDWRFHKIDLANPPATAKWEGKVTKLRLDPFRGKDAREITIKSVGFYKDAVAYNKAQKAQAEASIAAGQPVLLLNPAITNICFPTAGTQCDITYVDNYAVITSNSGPEEGKGTNGDPHFSVKTDFDGDKWHWMKVRLRNLSVATQFEMHFAAEGTENKITGSSCTHFPITQKDADFVEYIIDVKAANLASQSVNEGVSFTDSVWSGTVSEVRLDCMWKAEPSGQMPTGSQMYIDYVAFFQSEADAKAYTPDASTEIEQPKKNTGAETPIWIFDSEEAVKAQSSSGSDVSYTGGMLRMIPNNSDPILNLLLPYQFDTQEFPILAYRHSTKSKVSVLGVFYSTNSGTDLAESYSPVTINNTGAWSNAIVDLGDLSTYTKGTWNGKVTSMRLDPINGNDPDAVIYLDRVGFFRTKSEAYAFLAEGRSDIDYTASANFKATKQNALIPANTLYSGYNEADFLLSSIT
ncbi:MAG: hypothetical protein IJO52_01390, partial [Clostridia bacterium]|nr:hypothetical protein [Clostridia bacterium]